MKRFDKIIVGTKDGRCFFHVLGDFTEYHDISSMEYAHPELKDYVQNNRVELERALLQQRELMSADSYV